MSAPRGIEERIDWFLTHDPSGSGMCAQHTWHALGGDQGNPPAWGCSDANQCVDKVKAAGRYETPDSWDGPPPRGAWVGYQYGSNGHACLSLGDGRIVTTDPGSGAPTGIEDLDYPNRWGASGWDVWTDQYNGVQFAVASDSGTVTEQIYSDRLGYGEPTNGDTSSDTVAELQVVLNATSMDPPGDIMLPLTGFYDDETDTVVRAWQAQIAGDTPDPEGQSYLGQRQRELMFPSPPYTIHDRGLPAIALDEEPPPPDPSPDPPHTVTFPLGIQYHYSGKPAGTLTVTGGYKRLDVDTFKPAAAGVTFGMLYANVDGSGELRSRLIREANGGATTEDPTAYQSHYPKSGDNYLLTHVWFEDGEANRGLHYELSTMDGETMQVGTRYAKFVSVPWDVVLTVAEVGATYQAIRPRLLPLLRLLGVDLPDDLRTVLGGLIRDRA